jgi:hypothetical protein
MNKTKIFISLMIFMVSCPDMRLTAQIIDYRGEESPAISWNGVSYYDARLLSLAGISTMASDAFAGTVNPALGTGNKKINLSLSLNFLDYESLQYRGINQGVIRETSRISDQKLLFSGLALTIPVSSLTVSAGWLIHNLMEFPSFQYAQAYEQESWVYEGEFQGRENTCYLAIARTFGQAFNVGIKVDYAFGNRDLEINDIYHFVYLNNPEFNRIKQRENHDLNYLSLSAGAAWNIVPNWTVSAALICPLEGHVIREVTREFYSSLTGQRIAISSQEHKNTIFRPMRVHFGTTHEFAVSRKNAARRLLVAAEAVYSVWSGYWYEFFLETLPRDFKNTLTLAGAIEFGDYKQARDLFFRIGYRFDPQPPREPSANIHNLSGGVGIRLGKISWDFGISYYFCSVGGYRQNHLVLASTLNVILKRGK